MLAWHPGRPEAMGQEMSLEKAFRKLQKNLPYYHKMAFGV